MAAVLLALEQIQQFDLRVLPRILGLSIVAIASLVALVWQEKRSGTPLLPISLLRRPAIWRSDALAACHGATLVSLITFMPIYLWVVRGTSAAETGLLLLPLTAGVGVGSMITGQIVSRTGRTAVFPSWGLVVVVLTLLSLAFWAPRLSTAHLLWLFGINAVFMGTVMGVVQVTVQDAADPKLLGAAAGSVQFCRSMGAAFGTAVVGAVLFTVLMAMDPDTARLFGSLVEQGPGVLAGLPAERQAMVRAEIAVAFRAAFLVIAGFAFGGLVLAWLIPERRIR